MCTLRAWNMKLLEEASSQTLNLHNPDHEDSRSGWSRCCDWHFLVVLPRNFPGWIGPRRWFGGIRVCWPRYGTCVSGLHFNPFWGVCSSHKRTMFSYVAVLCLDSGVWCICPLCCAHMHACMPFQIGVDICAHTHTHIYIYICM